MPQTLIFCTNKKLLKIDNISLKKDRKYLFLEGRVEDTLYSFEIKVSRLLLRINGLICQTLCATTMSSQLARPKDAQRDHTE